MKVGVAQRDVPVHVINEYCRKDRSFDPLPKFNEDKLPRVLIFYNCNTERDESLFPLAVSDSVGLSLDFAVIRALRRATRCGCRGARSADGWRAAIDLAAVTRLDEVRTEDLTLSRENLKPKELKYLFNPVW
jgi:hypothetical protein